MYCSLQHRIYNFPEKIHCNITLLGFVISRSLGEGQVFISQYANESFPTSTQKHCKETNLEPITITHLPVMQVLLRVQVLLTPYDRGDGE